MIEERSGKRRYEKIAFQCIQEFDAGFNIVRRMKCEKAKMNPSNIVELEKATARHLGRLNCGFASRYFKKAGMQNTDETHFIVNMDSGKTIYVVGYDEVRDADVTSDLN